jgi:hypothetical protein
MSLERGIHEPHHAAIGESDEDGAIRLLDPGPVAGLDLSGVRDVPE